MVIRIIRKGNSHAEEEMNLTVTPVKHVTFIKKKPLTLKQQATIALVGEGRKSKAQILREAGYGPSVVDQPSKVFNNPAVANAVDDVVSKIAANRDRILEALAQKDFTKINPFNLSMMMNMHNKDVELLSGRPTSREEYVLPEEEQQRLRELLDLNK